MQCQGYIQIVVQRQDEILTIKFNNPKKHNSLNRVTYCEIARALNDASSDDGITLVVFTGVGQYYSTGNNCMPPMASMVDTDVYIRYANQMFSKMINAFMVCLKVIVSLVNGPCLDTAIILASFSDIVWYGT